MRWSVLLLCLLAIGLPAHAQQRTLDVPATARWQHARSGLVLPTAIDGLPRRGIIENTPDELDMMAHYEDGDTRISLFLYRPSLFDVGIWFDRAETVLRANPMFGAVTPAAPAPILFAPPGATVASAMRQSYAASGDYRATALAIVPTGRWLVKIRVSSRTGTAEQVDARVSAALAAIRFDAARHAGLAARPIQPCAVPVRWRDARQQRATIEDALMGSLMGSIIAGRDTGDEAGGAAADGQSAQQPAAFVPPLPDPTTCRDGSGDARYAVYRRPGEAGSYAMAVGDAGGWASVGEALTLAALTGPEGGRRPFGVTFFAGNEALVYANFNRLPSPTQVYGLLERGAPMSSSSNDPDLGPAAPGNNDVTISVPAG